MSKDSTQVLTAGPNCRLWLADVGATAPATYDADFDDTWTDMGYLQDPPKPARALSKTDIEAWNAIDPLRTVTSSDISTVELNLQQTNRATFELYFGALTYTPDGGVGVNISPVTAAGDIEKELCLELVDGDKVLRVFWARCVIDSVGNLTLDKAAAIAYDLTMKRLTPASGDAFFFQTNVDGLVSA